MFVRCRVMQCGYNTNGCCSRGVTAITEQGICGYIGKPEWDQDKSNKEAINIITLAKKEEEIEKIEEKKEDAKEAD